MNPKTAHCVFTAALDMWSWNVNAQAGPTKDSRDLVKLYIEMDRSNHGDGRVKISVPGKDSKRALKKRSQGKEKCRPQTASHSAARFVPSKKSLRPLTSNIDSIRNRKQFRRPTTAHARIGNTRQIKKSQQRPQSAYRDCIFHESMVEQQSFFRPIIDQFYISPSKFGVGSQLPVYKNVHKNVNQSPCFSSEIVEQPPLYNMRKDKKNRSERLGPIRSHDDRYWNGSSFVDKVCARNKEKKKNGLPKKMLPKSSYFRSKTRSRPSSAAHYHNPSQTCNLLHKQFDADISMAVVGTGGNSGKGGCFSWTEVDSIRHWNGKPTPKFGTQTGIRHVFQDEPITNYKGGIIGYQRHF